jgi:Mlc titration factor MtfA (ptsG expression regulator)
MLGLTRLRRHLALKRFPLPEPTWREMRARLPPTRRLSDSELATLRDLIALFLREKAIEGATDPSTGGRLQVGRETRLWIAAWACLPILHLGLDYYDDWSSVIVYLGDFLTHHEEVDEAGVVHRSERILSGEAWERGPVIVSLDEPDRPVWADGTVVLHECAHKLDMRNGPANGMPALHRGMSRGAWTEDLSAAYEDLDRRLEEGLPTPFDPYAVSAPGEFFAIMSEVFFLEPRLLLGQYPRVYAQLAAFYRQDPVKRG